MRSNHINQPSLEVVLGNHVKRMMYIIYVIISFFLNSFIYLVFIKVNIVNLITANKTDILCCDTSRPICMTTSLLTPAVLSGGRGVLTIMSQYFYTTSQHNPSAAVLWYTTIPNEPSWQHGENLKRKKSFVICDQINNVNFYVNIVQWTIDSNQVSPCGNVSQFNLVMWIPFK